MIVCDLLMKRSVDMNDCLGCATSMNYRNYIADGIVVVANIVGIIVEIGIGGFVEAVEVVLDRADVDDFVDMTHYAQNAMIRWEVMRCVIGRIVLEKIPVLHCRSSVVIVQIERVPVKTHQEY
jgi:hypothetical protein